MKICSLWNGSLAHIDELPLPSKENIDRFESRFDTLQRIFEKQSETQASTEDEIAQTQADIQAIDLSQEVPTESDLKNARGIRDKGWGLIRQNLEGRTPPAEESQEILRQFDNASDLPDAFEKSVVRADHIADRLRREADQVSRKGLLEAQNEKLEKVLADVSAKLEK